MRAPHTGADDVDFALNAPDENDPDAVYTPESHSSFTMRDTMPSPHITFVHVDVQIGPLPLRLASSHCSPASIRPLPHKSTDAEDAELVGLMVVWPCNRVPPMAATTAKSTPSTNAACFVSAGRRRMNRISPILDINAASRNRLDERFLVG